MSPDTNNRRYKRVTAHESSEDSPLLSQHLATSKLTESDFIFEPSFEDYLHEFVYLFKSAVPNISAYFLQAVMPLASVFAIGNIGTTELGAAALSNMFAAITGWSLGIGMASSLDTLCSQSFTGSNDPFAVGLHLQRGILVTITMFIPISFVWWFSGSLMLLLELDADLAVLCCTYLRILILAAPASMSFECIKKYLQAQRIMKAQTLIVVTTLPFNLLLNYFLVLNESTSLGFKGAPIATVITHWLTLLFALLYIKYIEGSSCWGGWSSQALTGWGVYIRLGIPGILMICSEWWAFEIMSLMASYLGKDKLAAHSVVLSITNVTFSIAIGQSISASNRIGNLIGASMPNRARISSRCALALALMLPFISVFTLLGFGWQIGSLFSKDPEVVKCIMVIIPVVSAYQVFDSVGSVSSGILRGQGRQKIGAVANLFAFYVLAIPLAIYLTRVVGFGVEGLWIGTCVALGITSTTVAIFVLRSDWNGQVAACRRRLSEMEGPRYT
ncbi:ethionine resistance protein [Entomophthora muscae]|uniref:Ethionine resistance protein n=2 Tax=Entomophthora muscae TaxID=34485 RepID=A0ACC2UCH8_9FUNG|nr:ethionine resistance protein [Entomophthora muscae]